MTRMQCLAGAVVIVAALASCAKARPAVAPPAAEPMPDLGRIETKPLGSLAAGGEGATEYVLALEGAVFQGEPAKPSPKTLTLHLARRGDEWREAVGASAPEFNKGLHSGKVADTRAGLAKLVLEMNIGSDQWVPGDKGARYELALRQTDAGEVLGTFKGRFRGAEVSGRATGWARVPGWRNVDAWRNADGSEPGALAVDLDMGTKRVNWNNARWAVYDMLGPVDVSMWDGLVVTAEVEEPRTDAWVDVAVMEDDGSWYYVRDAVGLSAKTNTAVVDLDDARHAEWIFDDEGTGAGASGNFDEDFHLDRAKVARFAFGTVNPLGVGRVAFRLTRVDLAKWKKRADLDRPVSVRVTGRTFRINDTDEVPPGLFGFHAAGGDPALVKELRCGSMRTCTAMAYGQSRLDKPQPENEIRFFVTGQYDRKQQLPQVENPNWEEPSRKVGRDLGEAAKPFGENAVIEWWNEPYLEIGRRLPGDVGRRAKPGPDTKEGDPVLLHGKELGSMVWTMDKGKLVPKDPTQFTYWSGRQISIWHTETLVAMAGEAKRIAPDIRIVGGFGFRWNEDEWAVWDILYKHEVDHAIGHLDGMCEHHYQGHTDGMPGTYEVLMAYTATRHGKPLKTYNTETNDLWDTPARGRTAAQDQSGGRFKARRRMVYNLRDILWCVKQTPDKIVTRAIHALWAPPKEQAPPADDGANTWGMDPGEYLALHLLRDLRGKLVEVESADRDVWAVASVDAKTRSLVTVVYNDSRLEKKVDLEIAAPKGAAFDGGYREAVLILDGGRNRRVEERIAAGGTRHRAGETLKPNHAVAISLKLEGELPTGPDLVRKQFFCDGILKKVEPGGRVALPVELGREAGAPKRAWVRCVVERLGRGEGFFEIGGRCHPIPAAYTPCNSTAIRQVEIDPALLAGAREVVFGASGPGEGNGFLLCMGSVVVEN